MITNAFGVGVAASVLAPVWPKATAHAAHGAYAAVSAAKAVKHRVAAATDASVDWGNT